MTTEAAFRPQRGRWVATWSALVALVLFGAVAVAVPSSSRGGDWTPIDRALMFALGAGIAALLLRYARIAAFPDKAGLRVRNLMLTRTIPWADIEEIRFGGGEPWVTLELLDGEEVAVMAIQRADSDRGIAEAQRLADLVETHTGRPLR